MINFIENSLFFGAALSLAGYEVGLLLKKKFKMALFNPLLIAILCVMGMLQLMQVDYKTYNAGGQYISYLLTPATVCLAVPLYRQLTLLRKNLKAVIIGIVSGVLASMVSVLIFAKLFGLSHSEYVTLLPKSITTAIGMGVSEELGGLVTITVAVIIITGVLGAGSIGISQMTALNLALLLTAAWWLLTTLPLLKSYKQLYYVEVEKHAVRQSFARIGHTLRHLPEDKQVFWFLLAFFCYIDGVYTIIDMATAYGTALGLDTTGLLLALLVTQIVAFPSALIFGRLSNKYPSAKLIPVCIAAYAGIAVFAFFLTQQWQFWVLAVIVGMFQGGVQALSRSHFAKIIPPEKSGEYFGLFDICGKGASFLGTMIVSVGSQLTGSANVGVGSLIVLFIVGFVLFRVSCKKEVVPE